MSQDNNGADGASSVTKRDCDDYSRPDWLGSDSKMNKEEESELIKKFGFISFLDRSNDFIRNVICKSNPQPKKE